MKTFAAVHPCLDLGFLKEDFKPIFPDLYQPGVVGVVFENNTVKFSPLTRQTVIITGPKPHAFLCEICDQKGIDPETLETRKNTDGSISTWFK
jgi:hypothetical protein